MSKRNIIIMCIIITIIIFSIFIYYIGRAYKENQIDFNASNGIIKENSLRSDIQTNDLQETSSKENIVVSPSAKIEMTQYYEECGHFVKEEYKVPTSIVNMSENKVKEYYSGWEVRSFSSDKIELYKKSDGMCNEHYVLRDIDGYVNVFVLNKKGNETLYRATDILTKYLSEADRASLVNGAYVVGKDDLEMMLQDFE